MNEIKITLPIPDKGLSSNSRSRTYHKRHRLLKQARYDGGLAARHALGRNAPPQWERAETQATFYFKDRRKRDEDNYAAMLKPTWDSFADAGIVINDRGFRHLPPVFEIDKNDARVEIVIKPIV